MYSNYKKKKQYAARRVHQRFVVLIYNNFIFISILKFIKFIINFWQE